MPQALRGAGKRLLKRHERDRCAEKILDLTLATNRHKKHKVINQKIAESKPPKGK